MACASQKRFTVPCVSQLTQLGGTSRKVEAEAKWAGCTGLIGCLQGLEIGWFVLTSSKEEGTPEVCNLTSKSCLTYLGHRLVY